MRVTTDITLDFGKKSNGVTVYAKQGDANSRFIKVIPLYNGQTWSIPEGTHAFFAARKPDGKHIYNEQTVEDNSILVELTDQTLVVSGRSLCSIVLTSDTGSILTTQNFNLDVEESPGAYAELESADEVQTLQKLIEYIEDLLENGGLGGGAPLSDELPLMNGESSPGVSKEASRADHVHPTDESRMTADIESLGSTRGVVDSTKFPLADPSGNLRYATWAILIETIKENIAPETAKTIEEALKTAVVEAARAVSDADGVNYAFLPEGMTEDGILALQSDITKALVDYLTREDAETYVQGYAQPKGDYIAADQLDGAIFDALAEAKASGEFDGKNGVDGKDGKDGTDGKSAYSYAIEGGYEGTEETFAKDINPESIKTDVAEIVKAEVPLVKTAEQPIFVNSVDEMTDANKVYVMPNGYMYAYREKENYNLFKLSEVSYSSRLQNDVSGIIASNVNNIVTGWIPVKYGKFYTPSVLYNGSRIVGDSTFSLVVRVNVKLDDGTIIVYGNTFDDRNKILYQPGVNETITLEHENAVAVMLHILIGNNDISNATKLEAYKPMVIEGDSVEDATNKSTTYEYLDGDAETVAEWYNTGHAFVPADYEDRILGLELDVSDLKEDMEEIKSDMQNPASSSPYYRDVNWGVVPTDYFRGRADSYSAEGFTNNTQYADYIEKLRALLTGHENYVTETNLGEASDGQPIYMYDFKPVRWDNELTSIPKIIIVAGNHGTEKCNVFGLYYLVKDLLNNWFGSPALEYLRNHVELMIVPVVNTYGFDKFQYKNANEVNINRNYPSDWKKVDDKTSPQYGGLNPFSEPESNIIRDLVLSNSDAVLVIDSHTNSSTNTESWDKLGYYGINNINDAYFNRIRNALPELVSRISPNFNTDYELNAPNTMFGFLAVGGGNGILRTWACDNNILGVLIEGFAGFLEGEPVSADIFKANEEQMVNWLITATNYLAK